MLLTGSHSTAHQLHPNAKCFWCLKKKRTMQPRAQCGRTSLVGGPAKEKGLGRCLCHRGGHGGVDAHMPVCAQSSPGGAFVTKSVSAFGPGSQGSLETPEASQGRGVHYAPALRPYLSCAHKVMGGRAERPPYPTAQLRRKLGPGCS